MGLAARTFRGSKAGASGGTPTTTPDTLRSQDTVELVLGISEGPIKGLVAGPKSFHVGDTALKAANGDSNFDAFTLNEFHGQPGEKITFTLGGQASPVVVNQQLHKDVAVTRTGNATHIDHIDVRLFVQQLYENQHSGDVDVTDLVFEIFHKPTLSGTWTSSFGDKLTIRGKETGAGYAKEFRFPVADIAGTYDVQVVLYYPPDNDSQHHATVSWDSFSQIVGGNWTWPGLAYTQVVARGNDQFTSVPQFWGEYDGRIVKIPSVMTQTGPSARTYSAGVWDGTYVLGWTDDPAWIAKDIVENTTYGLAKYSPGLTLDPADAVVASKWWSTPVSDGSGGQHPRFSMNLLLDEGKSGPEALAYVVGACGGVCFEGDAGVINLKVDRPTSPVHLFTKENTVGDFEYSWSDWQTRYNDVTVSFVNKFLDYRSETRRVKDDAHVAKYGPIPLQISAVGCTHPQEAIRRARHRVVTATTECQTVTLRTNRLGQAVLPYDVILVGDPDLGYGVTGRITGLVPGFTNRFTLRDPVPIAVGSSYQARWQIPDGAGGYTVVTTPLAATQPTGLPTQLWLSGGAPAGLPEYAVFELELTTGSAIAKPFRVMRVTEVDGSPDLHEVTALEINVNKWSYIDDGTTIVVIHYGFPPGDPDPPTALAAVVGTRTVSGNTVADLQVSWTGSVSPSVSRYEVSYRLNGGAAQLLTSTGDTFADLLSPLPGTYEIEVVALTISQQRSISAKTTIRVADSGRTVQPPANLRVKGVGGTSFAGRDLTFTWDQPTPESMFRDYVVQVMNGASVLRTQRVSTPEFLYTFDMNAADHGGVPSRSVQVQVQTEDIGLNLSTAAQQTFTNPAPGAPANATALATVNAVAIQLDPSPDPDVTAYQVYGSTVSGFTPGPSNLLYQGLNNTPLIKVTVGTTMYFRAACVDAFGPGPFTAEISASSVDSQIADGSITAQKLADGAVTMPKIAPRSVATSALAIGDFTNLALNGDFGAGLDGWTFSPTLTGETRQVLTTGLPAAPTDWAVPQALRLDSTGVSASGWAGFQGQIPVTPGDQYYVSALFAGVAGAQAAVTVRWTMADGSTQDADGPKPSAQVTLQPGFLLQASDVFTAPPLAKYATLRPRIRNAAPAGTYWVALGTLRHMTPAVLIQDGAVIAPKIVAGAIQTDHLAAGAVSADKIQAGAITADKIAIGDFSNLVPDPQFEHGGSWDLPSGWTVVLRDAPGVPIDAPSGNVLRILPTADFHGLISGNAWPTRDLTFVFPAAGFTNWGDTTSPVDGITVPLSTSWSPCPTPLVAAWRRAFTEMARSGMTFTELPAAQADSANIKIGVSTTLNSYPFSAYSSYPPKGWVFLQAQLAAGDFSVGGYLFQVLLHELGHLVGLQHPPAGVLNNYALTIMIPDSRFVSPWATTYRDYDILAVQEIYPDQPRGVVPDVSLAGPGFGTVPISQTVTTPVTTTVALSQTGDTDATVAWTLIGLTSTDVVGGGLSGTVTVPAGATSSPLRVVFAAQSLLTSKNATLTISPLTGCVPGTPMSQSFVLQANAVGPPVVSLPSGFGVVPVSQTGTVVDTATMALTAPAPAGVSVGWIITGLAASDVVGGALTGRVSFATGASSATLSVTFTAQTLTADKVATLTISAPTGCTLGTPTAQTFQLAANSVGAGSGWWLIPGGNRSGRLWNRGPGLTFYNYDTYEAKVCPIDVVSGGSARASGAGVPDWNALAGGPLSLSNPSAYDNYAAIQNLSMLDEGGTNWANALDFSAKYPGKVWCIWVMQTVPENGASTATNNRWATYGVAGPHDDYWYAMGRRARAVITHYGIDPWQLILRPNHEMNQSNTYQVFPGQLNDYAKAMQRFCAAFRSGYGSTSRGRVRIVFSPARHNNLGPLESLFTPVVGAASFYDAVDVSLHPAGQINYAESQPYSAQLQAAQDYLNGVVDPDGYAPNHVDPTLSQWALCQKYSLPLINTEWSPRYDTANPCHIAKAVHQVVHDWFLAHKDQLAMEAVFHSNTINETDIVPGWRAGALLYEQLWAGDLSGPVIPGNQYAVGPAWGTNWVQHKASGATSTIVQATAKITLTGGTVAATNPDQHNGVALWSKRRKVGDGQATFTTKLVDTTSPASSTLTEEMFGFYWGMSGAKTGFPADLTAWATTTEPFTHTYRDNCTGAALFFYYQADATPSLGRVMGLRVYKADGTANPVFGTTVFPNAQGVTYTWTIAWNGNTVQITCTDGVTTWTDSITNTLLAANADTGNVGLLVSPQRVVEVGDITLDATTVVITPPGGVYDPGIYDLAVYS